MSINGNDVSWWAVYTPIGFAGTCQKMIDIDEE